MLLNRSCSNDDLLSVAFAECFFRVFRRSVRHVGNRVKIGFAFISPFMRRKSGHRPNNGGLREIELKVTSVEEVLVQHLGQPVELGFRGFDTAVHLTSHLSSGFGFHC